MTVITFPRSLWWIKDKDCRKLTRNVIFSTCVPFLGSHLMKTEFCLLWQHQCCIAANSRSQWLENHLWQNWYSCSLKDYPIPTGKFYKTVSTNNTKGTEYIVILYVYMYIYILNIRYMFIEKFMERKNYLVVSWCHVFQT